MSWFEHFFEGLATEVWRKSVSEDQTADELAFIFQHLDVQEGASILDIPCADGRLAVPLARAGLKVTAVDLSERCLNAARKEAGEGSTIEFVRADMRDLKFSSQFDGAVCMGNSFGYFDRQATIKFLSGVERSLKPGGVFILDTCLAAETYFTVGGAKEWVEVGGALMLMEGDYQPREGRLDSRFIFIDGDRYEEHRTEHWIFTAADICAMCQSVGFECVEMFGDVEASPFTLGSERLLLHLRKPD